MIAVLLKANQALTTRGYPTVIVYVPQSSATKVLFAVRDENEEYDERAIVSISSERSINC